MNIRFSQRDASKRKAFHLAMSRQNLYANDAERQHRYRSFHLEMADLYQDLWEAWDLAYLVPDHRKMVAECHDAIYARLMAPKVLDAKPADQKSSKP